MRKKLFLILIFLLIINAYVYGKNVNKTKSIKLFHKNTKQKETKSRMRRSLDEDFDKLFTSTKDLTHYGHIVEGRGKIVKIQPIIDKEPPFWGSRGRRDSSEEIVPNVQLPAYNHHKHYEKINNLHRLYINYEDKLRKDEEDSPFWGNRGRRDSYESDENDVNLFWANRGKRQDDEPFWGTRGRRENMLRLWAGRSDDDEPFWGNRGRRQEQEQEPFWGNRGRREKSDHLGSNKVRNIYIGNAIDEPLDENKNAFEVKLKNTIIDTINHIQHKLGKSERNKRDEPRLPFWNNRGRDSKLMSLFDGKIRNRLHYVLNDPNKAAKNLRSRTFEQNTVNDDRIYAEEPRYIVVERSSRSSAEDDPFYISRGKKYIDLDNAVRGRRGSIEDLVKSVRNDPYYIARGKKQSYKVKSENSTKADDFSKTKELICSTVGILMAKFHGNKVKREVNDNERNRRTILKKLALQLQMDPYFVSRGKKNDKSNENMNSEDFINNIVTMCN